MTSWPWSATTRVRRSTRRSAGGFSVARNPRNAWPAGMTWVFQGTVLEDATGGTHVTSLTVTPGAGNEFLILYGGISAGAGAANLVFVKITDGTNLLARFANGTSLASGEQWWFPSTGASATQ